MIQSRTGNSDWLNTPQARRFLRLPEVKNRVGYGRATIYRKMNAGMFPQSYDLGARAVAWLESDIDAWIEGRIEKQKAAGAGRQSQ